MGRRWQWGLGIGCAGLLLLLLAVAGAGTWYAVQLNKDYKAVERSEKALMAATLPVGGFVPPHDGVPRADRLEAFASVREDLSEWQANLVRAGKDFAADQEAPQGGPVGRIFRLLSAGSDLAPAYAGFWQARNRALQERGMGPEEYIYLYCLVYYAWLGRDPADAEVRDRIDHAAAVRVVNGLMAPLLARSGGLTDEAGLLMDNPDRMPWQDGLPDPMAVALEPFRARLAATYHPAANPVEMMFDRVGMTTAPRGDY